MPPAHSYPGPIWLCRTCIDIPPPLSNDVVAATPLGMFFPATVVTSPSYRTGSHTITLRSFPHLSLILSRVVVFIACTDNTTCAGNPDFGPNSGFIMYVDCKSRTAICLAGFSTGTGPPLTATCVAGQWNVSGMCTRGEAQK